LDITIHWLVRHLQIRQ